MIIMIMEAMVARGHEVDLLTWDHKEAEAFYAMHSSIRWHKLDIGDPARKASTREILRRASHVRGILRDRHPSIIVAFQDGPFLALALYAFGLGIPLIAAERNAPDRFNHTNSGMSQRHVIFNSFRLARSIVLQSDGYRKGYPSYLQGRLVTIPNPVIPATVVARPDRPDADGRWQLLSVGRLSYQKNFESLLFAYARLTDRFPAWELVILGEGEEREKLQDLIGRLKLKGRVTLPGAVKNVETWYGRSHLFCLPSRWEGFPNALAEALSHGLPAVGFAECEGVNQLIRDGVVGYLAQGNGNPESLAAALSSAMSDPRQRLSMGAAARVAMRSYAPAQVLDLWEQVITNGARA